MNFELDLTDVRQTPEYAQYMQLIGWQVEKLKGNYIYLKKIPITPFSVLKILRYKNKFEQKHLTELCLKNYVIIKKLQPFKIEKIINSQIYFQVLKKYGQPLIPTKTIWIDLNKSEKELLQNLKQKTRYNLRKAQEKLKTEIIYADKINAQQLDQFIDLWSANKPFNFLFRPPIKDLESLIKAFTYKAFFVFVSKNSQLLASVFAINSPDIVYDWFGASNKLGDKYFAKTLAIWTTILEGKKLGKKYFDFEGVWDERLPNVNKGWQGFTRFKLGFVKG